MRHSIRQLKARVDRRDLLLYGGTVVVVAFGWLLEWWMGY